MKFFFIKSNIVKFSVFSVIFILSKKQKFYLFFNASFLYWTNSWFFFFFFDTLWFCLFLLVTSFYNALLLFFYSSFVLFIILCSFFFRIILFCFLQDFLPIKPVIVHFYILVWQFFENKKKNENKNKNKKVQALEINYFIIYNTPLSYVTELFNLFKPSFLLIPIKIHL